MFLFHRATVVHSPSKGDKPEEMVKKRNLDYGIRTGRRAARELNCSSCCSTAGFHTSSYRTTSDTDTAHCILWNFEIPTCEMTQTRAQYCTAGFQTEHQILPLAPNQSEMALSSFFPRIIIDQSINSGTIDQWSISRYSQFPGRDHPREHAGLSLCDKQQSLLRRPSGALHRPVNDPCLCSRN